MATATHNALGKAWAHITISTAGQGHIAVFTQDSGPTSGHQVITVDGSRAEVVLLGGVAYIRGDATAVTSFFGFPTAQVGRLANHWISLVATDTDFLTVTDAVTLASALDNTTITAPFTVGAQRVIDGVTAVAVSGQVPQSVSGQSATGTLYVSIGSDPLPVELDEVDSDGTTSTLKFSAWMVAAPLVAPRGAITASSIAGNTTA